MEINVLLKAGLYLIDFKRSERKFYINKKKLYYKIIYEKQLK